MEDAGRVNSSKELLCSLLVFSHNHIRVAWSIPIGEGNDEERQWDDEAEERQVNKVVFDLLVDVINSLLHASNHLNRASQAAVFKGKFCCLGRDDDLEAN